MSSEKLVFYGSFTIQHLLRETLSNAILDDALLDADGGIPDSDLGLVFALDLVFDLMQSVVAHAFLAHCDLFEDIRGFLSTVKSSLRLSILFQNRLSYLYFCHCRL